MRPEISVPRAGEKANDAARAHFDFATLPDIELPEFPESPTTGAPEWLTAPDLPSPDVPEVAGSVPDVDLPDIFYL